MSSTSSNLRCVMAAAMITLPSISVGQEVQSRTAVILSPTDTDGRLFAAREAIEFWNRTFTDAKLALRFVEAPMIIASPISAALEGLVQGISETSSEPSNEPRELTELPGDVIVFLSKNEQLISFAWSVRPRRALVAIRSDTGPPLSLPNVARNVIAHELGHTLGLQHNTDPSTLMCGRPASCRPGLFQSEYPRFFPLTEQDAASLQRLSDAGPR